MFGNLVESGTHKSEYGRKGSFFVGTLGVYVVAFLIIGVASIYAYNTHLDKLDDFDLRVMSMVESPAQEQPTIRAVRPASSSNRARGESSPMITVREKPDMVSFDPSLVKEGTRVSRAAIQLPVGGVYRIGGETTGGNPFGTGGPGTGSNGSGGTSKGVEDLVNETPPPAVEPSRPTKTVVRSLGPVNGIAVHLPKPAYTAIAKAARAQGTVTVQVLIDEKGNVVSARGIDGHPLLLRESVEAAYKARFTPTLLSRVPVKVSGVITYNFVLG